MGTLWRRGVRPLTLVTSLAIVFSLIPAPANASHGVDLVNAAPTGWVSSIIGTAASGGNDNCPTSLGCDANDATGRRVDDHCGSQDPGVGRGTHNYCTAAVTWTRSSGVTTFDVSSFRIKVQTCQTGAGSSCGGATLDMVAVIVTGWTAGGCNATEHYYTTQTAAATYDTGEADLVTMPLSIANNQGLCFYFEMTAMNTNQWLTVASIEVRAEGLAATEADIEDYVFNLRMSHPAFARQITWQWRKTYTGTWQVTDVEDEVLASGTMPGNEFPGATEVVIISCQPVCGEDTYTLYVDDTGDNLFAAYEIDGDADGVLIDNVLPPDILWAQACYNATLDQCAAPLNGAAGKVVIQYEWTGSESAVAGFCKTGPGNPPPCTGTTSSSSSQTEGTHAVTFTITVGGQWKVRVEDTTTASDYALFMVDYSNPGTVTTYTPPPVLEEDCDSSDNICYLRGLLVGLLGALGDIGADVFTGAYDTLTGALMAKQPFAFIFGSIGAAGSQISRAQASVVSSDDCAGVAFTMPSLPPIAYHAFGADKTANPQYYAFNGTVPTATPFAFSALRCEDLEPWGGTDWWQGMRAVMGPALVLGYFVSLLRRYEVKPQLGG